MEKNELRLREVDRMAVQRLIDREYDSLAGIILRLAWQLGLTRQEIHRLKWSQFSTDFSSVVVEGRTIPLESSVGLFFESLCETSIAEEVVVSSIRKAPISEQYISALASKELQSIGLYDIKLSDLRSDYILQQMERYPLNYVAQISNMQYFTLQTVYLPSLQARKKEPVAPLEEQPEITKEKIEKIILDEQGSTIGLILDMVWNTEIPVTAVPALKWRQIDLRAGNFTMDGNTYILPERLKKQMRELRKITDSSDDSVFLSARTRKPINAAYVSRMARELFVKNGLYGITLTQLQVLKKHGGKMAEIDAIYSDIISLLKAQGQIQKNDVSKAFGVDAKTAHGWLSELERRGNLHRYGSRYYLGKVDHWSKSYTQRILEYLETHPNCTRTEIETALEAPPRSAHIHLAQLMRNGKVKRTGVRYSTN